MAFYDGTSSNPTSEDFEREYRSNYDSNYEEIKCCEEVGSQLVCNENYVKEMLEKFIESPGESKLATIGLVANGRNGALAGNLKKLMKKEKSSFKEIGLVDDTLLVFMADREDKDMFNLISSAGKGIERFTPTALVKEYEGINDLGMDFRDGFRPVFERLGRFSGRILYSEDL